MVEHYCEDFSFTPLVSGLLLLGIGVLTRGTPSDFLDEFS